MCFILLLTTVSSIYAGSCFEEPYDVKDCKTKAEQGDATAQNNLGLMYYLGKGVPQDYKQAVNWYRKAAEQGFASAQSNLGLMYANGQGVPQDYVMAHMLWNVAAANGHKEATENREIVAKKMTPSQIEEAQKLAREWMRKHE